MQIQQRLLYITFLLPVLYQCKSLKELPSECFDALELKNVETRNFMKDNTPTSSSNDLQLKPGWYRVLGSGLNGLQQGYHRRIPLSGSSAVPNICGTEYAGTLMGEHPTEEEGMVEMTVCFRERFCFIEDRNCDKCDKTNTIKIFVRNCRRHYIYYLKPTKGDQRYCTGSNRLFGAKLNGSGESDAVECTEYKELTEMNRLWNEISDVKCDDHIGEWFRFTKNVNKNAGTELASVCTLNNKTVTRLGQPCGAEFRGWMIDRHPTVLEGRVQRRICFSYADHCTCDMYGRISVRNCGKYYVYQLAPVPMCEARYCAAPDDSKAEVNDKNKPAVAKKHDDMCSRYTVHYDPDRLWSYTSPTIKRCDAALYGRYRFGSKYTPWSLKEGCDKKDMAIVTHRCGSTYQGFMIGAHPEPIDGYVERLMCFQKADVPCECQFTVVVGVKHCGKFFVYDFKGVPKCEARYCMVANGSAAIRIDPNDPPQYELRPPAYQPATERVIKEDNESGLVATTTVLSIIVLIVLILLILIILFLCYRAWPSIKERKQNRASQPQRVQVSLRQESPEVFRNSDYNKDKPSSSNGLPPPQQKQSPPDEKVQDLDEPPIAPYPSVPPKKISDDELSLHSNESLDEDDGEFDTLMKKEDMQKPKSYDSAV